MWCVKLQLNCASDHHLIVSDRYMGALTPLFGYISEDHHSAERVLTRPSMTSILPQVATNARSLGPERKERIAELSAFWSWWLTTILPIVLRICISLFPMSDGCINWEYQKYHTNHEKGYSKRNRNEDLELDDQGGSKSFHHYVDTFETKNGRKNEELGRIEQTWEWWKEANKMSKYKNNS